MWANGVVGDHSLPSPKDLCGVKAPGEVSTVGFVADCLIIEAGLFGTTVRPIVVEDAHVIARTTVAAPQPVRQIHGVAGRTGDDVLVRDETFV